jgi:RNA polymerase sigma-70 factor (ECF subfamily)
MMLTFASSPAQSIAMDSPPTPSDRSERRPEPSALDPESSLVLVLRARNGDEAALNDLFQRYSRRLKIWAHGRLPAWARGPADTADVVQDTLLQVIRKLDAFVPQHEGAFLAYVRLTLRNNITDRIRQAQRRGPVEPLSSANTSPLASPEQDAIASELLDRYEAALERLRPDQREAIIARIELRLPWPEVATSLNKPSIPAAQMAVKRALVRLAREMSPARPA